MCFNAIKSILPVCRVTAVPVVSFTYARKDNQIFAETKDAFSTPLVTLDPCMIPSRHMERTQEAYLPQASSYEG